VTQKLKITLNLGRREYETIKRNFVLRMSVLSKFYFIFYDMIVLKIMR